MLHLLGALEQMCRRGAGSGAFIARGEDLARGSGDGCGVEGQYFDTIGNLERHTSEVFRFGNDDGFDALSRERRVTA